MMRLLQFVVVGLAVGCGGQSAQRMADHIETMIHVQKVTGDCAACSAVVESLYKVIANGEGHHVNDAATLLPQIFDTATRGFSYNPKLDQWDRRDEPGEPEEHMHNYIVDKVIKSHNMMVVLSPYYLQNERHNLHTVLCVQLMKHCTEGFSTDAHHEDIHEDYDLHKKQQRYVPDRDHGYDL